MRAGYQVLQAHGAFNLRCPRNGKTDECRALDFSQVRRPNSAFIISH